ncbi:hypothetical protein Mterra_03354 [Calidithermus terrae]|uniref:Uncharacterized protein n=1 Tax=Calidithermus terrae TaxID=1408545 RepID=A0A399E8V4_9DEIN|nr:hypothetical protein [Calidithermus terrae]RIH81147.1 hypothetical protein Mterra_03354 [Calidithermus terrae]
MKEASRESQRKYHGVKGETLAEIFKAADRREQVSGELVDRLCLQVLRTYPEIPEEDHPWMLEHVRDGVEDFLYYANWDYFKGLAEYRKNHDGKTYDENILIPEIMRAAKIL